MTGKLLVIASLSLPEIFDQRPCRASNPKMNIEPAGHSMAIAFSSGTPELGAEFRDGSGRQGAPFAAENRHRKHHVDRSENNR